MKQLFNTKLEQHSVQTLLENLKRKIDLSPIYQRGEVWSNKMKSDYIDSLIIGIVPSNLIFNKEYKDDREIITCIDGKQRITAIQQFYENKIPYISIDYDTDQETHTYYSRIPRDQKSKIKYATLSDKDKFTLFLDRTIPVAYYSNIAYENQVDIFSRINHCSVATSGEILISKFTDPIIANKVKKFLDSFSFQERNNHYDYIFSSMYMIHNTCPILLRPEKKDKFVSELSDAKTLDNLISECKDTLSRYYSKNIILHKKITKLNLTKNFIIAMCYFIHEYCRSDEDQDIITYITDTWNLWKKDNNSKKKTDKSLKILENIFLDVIRGKDEDDEDYEENEED